MTSTEDFETAGRAFIEMVGEIRPEQWSDPALGSWDVRSLVGHTSRAITIVEGYLADPPAPVRNVKDAEDYYATALDRFTDDAAIAARGVAAGAALNEDSGELFTETLDRTLRIVAAEPEDRLVAIGPLGIPLAEYLRTRVFELVVHGMDLTRATGVDHGIPDTIVSHTAELAARAAVRGGHGTAVLFALTGRAPLPPRFSIL